MTLTLKTLPSNLHAWQLREITRLRDELTDSVKVEERAGVKYWKSNGSVIPDSVFKDAYAECPAEQRAAYKAQTDAFLASYRKARKGHKPSAEERFEMRAAFGAGSTVVDVITGQQFRT
jgi:hypothetical protein